MLELHLSIIQGLARLETRRARNEAISEILDLLEDIVDGKLPPDLNRRAVNPFEGQILWAVEGRAN